MNRASRTTMLLLAAVGGLVPGKVGLRAQIGVEVSVPVHLQDGEEYQRPTRDLIAYGEKLFTTRRTIQEGAGRPLLKGTGGPFPTPPTRSGRRVCERTDPGRRDRRDAFPGHPPRAGPRDQHRPHHSRRRAERGTGVPGHWLCHIPLLPLTNQGWVYTEPNPCNPPGNLQVGDAPPLSVDLTSAELPGPRLKAHRGVVYVPAYTDFKLHDITSGPDDPNREPLDQNQPAGTPAFFAGNSKFITRRLWGIANQHPFGHHGRYTTMREAVLSHGGEAQAAGLAFRSLPACDRDCIIEFLKSLQILAAAARSLCVDEEGKDVECPPAS